MGHSLGTIALKAGVCVFVPTDGKPVLVVIVVLQTVALWHHLQLAGDVAAAADVGQLQRKDTPRSIETASATGPGGGMEEAPHHASQLAVELPGKRFHQIHVIAPGRFKQHLKRFEAVVRHAVHCGRGFV